MNTKLQHIQKMDEMMKNLENDKIFLENFYNKLSEISNRKKILENYYYNDWQADYEDFPHEQYGILSEDGLWNLFHEIEATEKEILKFLVAKL